MNYIKFWQELPVEERFKFLAMLDRHYRGNESEAGRGLEILYRSFIFKLREIDKELYESQKKPK